ncbi:MAG: putative lipid II flippase FtsW [Candidatus Wallbacteria bacterium]
MKIKEIGFDLFLFLIIIMLVCTGIVMIYSSSYYTALDMTQKSGFFLKKQLIALVIGFASMMILSQIDYWKLKKIVTPMTVVVLFLLAIVLLFPAKNGGRRWINIGPMTMQPAEFAKLNIILLFSTMLSSRQDKIQTFSNGIMPFIGILTVYNLLILKEPDFGTTSVLTLIGFFLMYIANANFGQLLLVVSTAMAGAFFVIINSFYKLQRVIAWWDPFKDAAGKGYHIIQSLIAIGSGGFFGVGLAQSKQKFNFLPEQYTDFIFAIICEELGMLGALLLLTLFLALLWRGIIIACRAPDLFGFLLASSIVFYISVQAFSNIAVVLNILPVTGIPLPFISFGGSSLLITMSSMGILLNISRYSR